MSKSVAPFPAAGPGGPTGPKPVGRRLWPQTPWPEIIGWKLLAGNYWPERTGLEITGLNSQGLKLRGLKLRGHLLANPGGRAVGRRKREEECGAGMHGATHGRLRQRWQRD
jgi:hypothetical protein